MQCWLLDSIQLLDAVDAAPAGGVTRRMVVVRPSLDPSLAFAPQAWLLQSAT